MDDEIVEVLEEAYTCEETRHFSGGGYLELRQEISKINDDIKQAMAKNIAALVRSLGSKTVQSHHPAKGSTKPNFTTKVHHRKRRR